MSKNIIFGSMIVIVVLLIGYGLFYSFNQTREPASPTAIPTAPAQALPDLGGEWTLKFTQSGGIAGISRKLELSSGGALTITDTRSGAKKESQLSAEKLAVLSTLVDSSVFHAAPQPSGCADCFVFELQITSDAGNFQEQVDQISLPDSGLQPLLDFLSALLNNAG